jgi:hypothetical protein
MVRMKKMVICFVAAFCVLAASTVVPGFGQEKKPAQPPEDSTAALAKAAQNPVANMISVPLQNNSNFKIGPYDRTQNIFNIQPVIPIELNEDWMLINRTITPLIYQPFVCQESGGKFGLGDINHTTWLAPAKPGAILWGVGPIISFPTATDDILGSGKWSAGPSAVALMMNGPWVNGVLINNIWDFAGESDRPHVNQMLIQYFINYNLPKGWFLTTAPILTANWKAKSGDQWIVPFGGGVGKVLKIGKQPLSCTAQAYYNSVRPTGSAEWTLRLQIALLFPMK